MNNLAQTVLVVDDNQANLGVLCDLLDKKGYRILAVKSGEQALKSIQVVNPDIILLDILMPPGIDGFETCKRLKSNPVSKDIPIIFMTALSDIVDKVKGFEIGAVDYITKPFQVEEVLVRVNTHLTIQKLKQELNAAFQKEKELNEWKSFFMSTILHDLRNPLGAIKISNYLLKKLEVSPIVETREKLYISVEKSLEEVTSILNQFFDISKLDDNKFEINYEYTNICDFCFKISQKYELLCHGTRTIKFNCYINDFFMNMDTKLTEHVVSNLISNAIKYSNINGEINIDVLKEKEEVIIRVTDFGIGIAPNDIPYLFEPYRRGENAKEINGWGLGLSIIKKLLDFYGGRITVESKLEEGSIFSVYLPIR